jgi:hypothetical protein
MRGEVCRAIQREPDHLRNGNDVNTNRRGKDEGREGKQARDSAFVSISVSDDDF